MVVLDSGIGSYVKIKEKTYSYFAGNDYLGLANHPEVIENACAALRSYGANFSASRVTTGTSQLHMDLEDKLAEFKHKQEAVVFASGYVGNMLLLHALNDQFTSVIADSMAHPSIIDGIPKRVSSVQYYSHLNIAQLEDLLKGQKTGRPLIITDGIFALTGEIAPLDEIHFLAKKYNALLVVDDAHATGVLGIHGRGTPEFFNLNDDEHVFQSETMSKALGGYGGFIAAQKNVVSIIRSKSTFYGASTALPPPIVATGLTALGIIASEPERRSKVHNNAVKLREGVRDLGFLTTDAPTPIIPLFFEEAITARNLSQFLEKNGIIAPSIDYPVKSDKFIVRITVSANHSEEQILKLLDCLKTW